MNNNNLNNNFDDKKAFKILSSIAILICIFIVLFNAWVGPSLAPSHREYEKILNVNLKNNNSAKIGESNSNNTDNKILEDLTSLSTSNNFNFDVQNDFDDFDDLDDLDNSDENFDDDSDEYPDDILVNINKADADELMMIPYVGQVLANRIIAYRENYGPFESIDELLNVEGIGEKRLFTIADYIYLE